MKNKIVVLRMQDIIKKGVFLVAGIAIIVFVISLFSGGEDTAYNTGTYQSNIVLHGKPVALNLTIDDGIITEITLNDLSETQAVFYPTFDDCFETISNSVIDAQSTNVELPEDYSMTGRILLDAINSALAQAKR